MSDASNFEIGAAFLQSHHGTNNMNLISANLSLFRQPELRISTIMREGTANLNTLTGYDLLTLESKHPTVVLPITTVELPQKNKAFSCQRRNLTTIRS